jgi:hypothetical protein
MKKVFFLFAALSLMACSTNKKKPKCNTCPKWDDRIEIAQ